MENKGTWYMKKEEKMQFKKGDRVQVVGVAGVGTVAHDQETPYVKVNWDNDPHRSSAPLGENLRIVGEGDTMEFAISSIEEKRQELIAERDALNVKIRNLDEAARLLKRV